MNRATVWAVCFGLALASAPHGICESPPELKRDKLVVLFIKVIEESDDKRSQQIVSEPTLTTPLGAPTGMKVGCQIPHRGDYIEVGQSFEFVPTRIRDKTIWVEIKSEFTEYVKDNQGNGRLSSKKKVTKRKFELGKMNVSEVEKWSFAPGTTMHLELWVEEMSYIQYVRMMAEAKAADSAKPR